ncbi:hypothetical protein UlMin_040275 [Ulmus minor]
MCDNNNRLVTHYLAQQNNQWKNCPITWAGQYAGRSGSPTIILEAVADYDIWI